MCISWRAPFPVPLGTVEQRLHIKGRADEFMAQTTLVALISNLCPMVRLLKIFAYYFNSFPFFFRGSSQAKSEETKRFQRRIKIRTLNFNAKNTFCSSRKSWMNVFLAMYFAIIEFAFSKIDCQYPILYNTFVRQKKFCCFPIINDTVSARYTYVLRTITFQTMKEWSLGLNPLLVALFALQIIGVFSAFDCR